MEFYHDTSGVTATILEDALNDELDRMTAANNREGRVIAWGRLRLLKELQAAVECDHA